MLHVVLREKAKVWMFLVSRTQLEAEHKGQLVKNPRCPARPQACETSALPLSYGLRVGN